MRIIGGFLKGHRFTPPARNWPTRPTTDISKEGLYNMLMSRVIIDEISFLDLFGGTGNHTYEMISRGARAATYVDAHWPCVKFVTEQCKTWDIDQFVTIVRSDVRKFLTDYNETYDIVFAGPPYGLEWLDDIPDLLFTSGVLGEGGLFILEHNPHHNFESHQRFQESRNYGQTIFSFFK